MTPPAWIDPGQGTNLIRVLIILVRVLNPMVALRFQAMGFLS